MAKEKKYKSVRQMVEVDKMSGKGKKVYPVTPIQAVYDARTGASLEAILAQFNNVFLQYQGSAAATRCLLPMELRRVGITISYRTLADALVTERCMNDVQRDNEYWGLDVNWARVDGQVVLSGELSVSEHGTWVVNGEDTGIVAQGAKGDNGLTPWLKFENNKLYGSYDKVKWDELSGLLATELRIKGYVSSYSALPSSAMQGEIWGVGPTNADTNPTYRYYVRNASGWVDNGEFTSIAAGIVQETGDGEGVVMSQKAVSGKLSELKSEIGVVSLELNEAYEVGTDVTGYESTIYRCPFRFKQGKTYRIENVSIAGKGLSAGLFGENGDVLQEIGTINPTPALTFVAKQDADFIGGYGTAWKVKISLVDTLEDKAEKGAETHSFVIGAKNEITYESEQGYFLNYNNGSKQSAGSDPLAVSKPIPVSKGQLVIAELSTLYDFVSAIAVTNAEGKSHKMVVKGNGNGVAKYFYIADKDGYIEVCFDYTLDNKVYISDSSLSQLFIETFGDKADKGAEVHSFVIGAETEVAYESEQGYFLNYNNGSKQSAGSNTLSVSKPIQVSKGQLIVAELSTLYDFVSAIAVTNAEGKSHKMVVKGNGNGVAKYFYIADKDGYIEVCFDYTLDNKVYISDSSLSQLLIETILSNSNSLPSINIGVDGDSITEGNQWSYYAAQILGANQYNVGVGSACWSYKDKYALDGKTIVSPQHYTDSDFVGFGGASNLDSDVKIQMWVNNNACTHIERFVASVENGTFPTPDVFVFAMGTNDDTSQNNSHGSVDEAMSAKSINDSDFVNKNGKSLKYTMCGAMRWCIETIKRNYPSCKVFVSLPIQRASYELNKDYLFPKVQLIKDMAIQMGCQIIDQYKGCGITSAIENDVSPYGPYLRDGLHPNTDGQKLMGAFAASQIKSKYFAVK